MFEQAARVKLRFDTPKGLLSVEDLWDLPLARGIANLDDIAIGLHHQTQNDTVSFVNADDKPDPILQLRFDVVKHIIGIRLEEKRKADDARDRAAQKQKLLEVLGRKQDAALEQASEEDIRAMIAAL